MTDFALTDQFIENYKTERPDWGPLGEFTYYRTYSRMINNRKEEWWETVKRVVEGTYNIQKKHCLGLRLPWNGNKAQSSAQKMFEKMFRFKFLPSGRGLWMMGTDFIDEHGGMALCSCAFISTEDIETKGTFPFTFAMDSSMHGVGVGFDTKGGGLMKIHEPSSKAMTFSIPDTREGWYQSVELLLRAYLYGKRIPSFDYSGIRPYGEPIKGFGGVASGPGPLQDLHKNINAMLSTRTGGVLSSIDIVDIMNMIGACVVSGNVRRSAQIALGFPTKEYIEMKDYRKYSHEVNNWRWVSNNSIFAEVGNTDYDSIAESIILNGEPGLIWLDNIRHYGRMADAKNGKDLNAKGVNPCITGDTLIETTEGKKRISDMLKGSWDIYTMNNKGELEIKPVHKVFHTKTVNKLCVVKLNNGSEIRCTPDHRFIVLNNKGAIIEVEAEKLSVENHTPIVLQRIKKSESYLRVKLNTQTKYYSEHRFIAAAYEDISGMFVHHIDGVTYHNFKSNLEVVSQSNHSSFSNKGHPDWGNRDSKTGMFLKKKFRVKAKSMAVPEKYLTGNKNCNGNYKFLSIEILEVTSTPVYDISVIDNHNFIANGVVIHNCVEQALESGELCALVETFPSRHNSYEEYKETLKFAYLYGKTITLLPTHIPETNQVMMKNRRIGTSQSGIIDAFSRHGRRDMLQWSDNGYNYLKDLDEKYSNWLCVPKSIKITSVKPSGTVSLLPGVSPGIHYPHSKYYIRRIQVADGNPLIDIATRAGFPVENCRTAKNTKVVSFPIYQKFFDRAKTEVTLWEQVQNAVDYQEYWADNNVSITATFKKEEARDIPKVLEAFEDRLKAISFLPHLDHGYKQAPYESIEKDEYTKLYDQIKPMDFSELSVEAEGEKYCTNDTCEVK